MGGWRTLVEARQPSDMSLTPTRARQLAHQFAVVDPEQE